jgi:predicted dehydrogenase
MGEPMRIGVVGLRPRGLYLAGMFADRPGARVCAVADPREDQIAIARTKFGDDFSYFGTGQALADSDDIVRLYLATGRGPRALQRSAARRRCASPPDTPRLCEG